MTTNQAALSQAAIDVLAERQRQIEAEGYTAETDRKYHRGELTRAGATYALAFLTARAWPTLRGTISAVCGWLWPWESHWFKSDKGRRDLVKACALLLAEIEREDRLFGELRGHGAGDIIIDEHSASTHAAEFPREPDWDPQP